MKKLFLLIMISSLFFMTGFASQQANNSGQYISLEIASFQNGVIIQSVDFSINSLWLSKNSNSVKEEMDFKKNLKTQIEGIRNEFLFSFALAYLQSPVEEYKINQGVTLSPVNVEGDNMGFKIIFAGVEEWNYYHGITHTNTPQKGNIFINKISSQGSFPFLATVQTAEKQLVGERYKEIYLASAKGLSFEERLKEDYNPNFIYTYSSFNKKLHSNADKTYYNENGLIAHSWQTQNLQENKNITLWQYAVNKGVWLIFAIALPLAGMAIVICIIKYKEGKRGR